MRILNFKVKNQELIPEHDFGAIVSDTAEYLEANFVFETDGWDECDIIHAYFRCLGKSYCFELKNGKTTQRLNLSAGKWGIYLAGFSTATDESGESILKKRITSTEYKIDVLPCGPLMGDAPGFKIPSVFEQKMSEVNAAEEARNVFEVYDPEKEYVRGNKVVYDGSSYVLVVSKSKGFSPTHTYDDNFPIVSPDDNPEDYLPGVDRWLCIASSSKVYAFSSGENRRGTSVGEIFYVNRLVIDSAGLSAIPVGSIAVIDGLIAERIEAGGAIAFKCVANPNGNRIKTESLNAPSDISVGEYLDDILISNFYGFLKGDLVVDSDSGAVFEMTSSGSHTSYKCVVAPSGSKGVFVSDKNGNITAGNNVSSCMAYYIKSIDLENKKIYLTDTKTLPVISTADNRDASFETPDYEIGKLFNIINQNQYLMRASIVSVQNNVVTYDGDLGFTEIYPDDDYDGHTFCVPEQPEIGVVQLSRYSFGVGDGNILAGRWAASVGRENVGMDYSFSAGKRNRAVYTAAALGEENDALGQGSFTACVKNKTTPKAYGGSAIGIKTVSNAHGQSVRGMYNAIDEKGEFLDIVGNGTGDGNRSNAYTLDKKGNARYMGKVYQENDTELATKAYAEKLGAKLSIEPDILFARKDDKLYSTARDSCNVVEMKDSDGIVYDHVTPLNHASKLLYDKFTESGKPFEIPLATGRIWLKLLMRSNQAVTPTAELYQVSTESGAALSSISSVATKAMSGNGEWEEVIIPFEGYIANAYKAKQIHIRLAGYDKNGSDFYDASGKLIGSPYFDIAGWAIFTDEEDFNRYEFYNEMVGIGSLNLPQLYDEVKELKSRLENGGAASGAMVFKGSVNVLPEKPQKGEVYKVTAEIYEGELKEYYVQNLNYYGQMDWNRHGYDFLSESSDAIPVFQEAFDAGLNGIPSYVAYYPYYSTPELLKFVDSRPQYEEDYADFVIETENPPGALTYNNGDITVYIGNPNPIYVEGDIIMFDGESWNKL